MNQKLKYYWWFNFINFFLDWLKKNKSENFEWNELDFIADPEIIFIITKNT